MTETPETAFALVKQDPEMLAPLTRREASVLQIKLHGAIYRITSSYSYETEPPSWVSELSWLESLAWHQAHNREAPRR